MTRPTSLLPLLRPVSVFTAAADLSRQLLIETNPERIECRARVGTRVRDAPP
jgi:hypothetical protein